MKRFVIFYKEVEVLVRYCPSDPFSHTYLKQAQKCSRRRMITMVDLDYFRSIPGRVGGAGAMWCAFYGVFLRN